MALNKEKLKADIIEIQKQMLKKDQQDFEDYAQRLTNAIDAFVRSGTVTIEAGISVATTGTSISQTGRTTSKGTGTIK